MRTEKGSQWRHFLIKNALETSSLSVFHFISENATCEHVLQISSTSRLHSLFRYIYFDRAYVPKGQWNPWIWNFHGFSYPKQSELSRFRRASRCVGHWKYSLPLLMLWKQLQTVRFNEKIKNNFFSSAQVIIQTIRSTLLQKTVRRISEIK